MVIAPVRTHRFKGNSREGKAARSLGIGEVRASFHRYDKALKRTVWSQGGVWLSDMDLERVNEALEKRESGPDEAASQIKPPHGARAKAIASYQLLLAEAVALGDAPDATARLVMWHRALSTYALPAGGEPPAVEVNESHSDRVAGLAVSRVDVNGDSDEEAARRAQRLRAARKSKKLSRGYVMGRRS